MGSISSSNNFEDTGVSAQIEESPGYYDPASFQQVLDGLKHVLDNPGASDLHVGPGDYMWMRHGAVYKPLHKFGIIDRETAKHVAGWSGGWNASSSVVFPENQRWRVQGFMCADQSGGWQPHINFRIIMDKPPPFESLGESIQPARAVASRGEGLVIVAGATGSGKSTTIASLINVIAESRENFILTIEDPIEYLFKSGGTRSKILQQELGLHVTSREQALKQALRSDVDVILLGESRTPKDFELCMELAATGHLVFTTIHARDCGTACERIAVATGDSGRSQLSQTLRYVISQRLVQDFKVPTKRHLAAEVIEVDYAIAGLLKPGEDLRRISEMVGNSGRGMDHILANMYRAEQIDFNAGLSACMSPQQYTEYAQRP